MPLPEYLRPVPDPDETEPKELPEENMPPQAKPEIKFASAAPEKPQATFAFDVNASGIQKAQKFFRIAQAHFTEVNKKQNRRYSVELSKRGKNIPVVIINPDDEVVEDWVRNNRQLLP